MNELHSINDDGKIFIEESSIGRLLFFIKNDRLKWQRLNKAKSGHLYKSVCSRILHTKEHMKMVNTFLKSKEPLQ